MVRYPREEISVKLPQNRGPVTYMLWADLLAYPSDCPLTATGGSVRQALRTSEDILYDEDLQLALFCLYELHGSGINGVDDRWEWDPGLLEVRHQIESAFEARLRRGTTELFGPEGQVPRSAEEVADRLSALTAGTNGPSVTDFVSREADTDQVREFLVHQSVRQLKESDPHCWSVPRLTGRPKAALVDLQADGYGSGQPHRVRSERFAAVMVSLGLDTGFGAYLEWMPALSLAAVNMISMFGLNRRLRGAAAGQLAIDEIGSLLPHAAYAEGLRRLGLPPVDEVPDVADAAVEQAEVGAVHGWAAGRDLAGGLVEQDPSLADDVFFGAASACLMDQLLGRWQLEAWHAGRSSLRRPLPSASAPRGGQHGPATEVGLPA